MAELHPIAREFIRQRQQGFCEDKKGRVGDNLSFEFMEAVPEAGVGRNELQIKRLRVPYLNPLPKKTFSQFAEGWAEFNVLPRSHYAAFEQQMNDLAALLGREERSTVSEYSECGVMIKWVEQKRPFFREAAAAYVFGKLRYRTPEGNSFVFSSNENSNHPYGDVILSFRPEGLLNTDVEPLEKICRYLERLPKI